MHMLAEMKQEGILPNVHTYTSAINSCQKDGKVDSLGIAEFLPDDFNRHGATVQTRNNYIRLLASSSFFSARSFCQLLAVRERTKNGVDDRF